MKQQRMKTKKNKDILNVQLELKCSCSPLTNHSNIQFSRRYLQCQSAMPVRALRLFIESIMPYSRMIKISMYDANDRLLKDSERLCSLKQTLSATNYIPVYFTLLNTVTSFANCSCISPLIECEPSSTVIQSSVIEQILSTCTVITPSISTADILRSLPTESNIAPDQMTIDQIIMEFGEICPPLSNLKRCSSIQDYSMDVPLDLSLKTRAIQWIKT
ncbi:unnamed protein product [Adineta ricciae]|uniref:Uncharacterized protein n=1 Tax=Adineta ricciae TaxID=249248 RepID=A0A815WGM9_ADIRI|nr:unnamed protein product [Adineta ricciae]